MLKLTPKIYSKNTKHSLLAQNKIDTVVLHPISNLAADKRVFHTEVVSAVDIDETEYTLPLSDNFKPTYYRYMSNTWWPGLLFGTCEFAKARIDCVIAEGKTRCNVAEVIQGVPTANIQLVGKSYKIDRGGSTYDTYPSVSNLTNKDFSITSWIKSNKTATSNNLTHAYYESYFNMNPWVRNIIPKDSGKSSTPNDLITEWVGPLDAWWTRTSAKFDKWSGYYDVPGKFNTFEMYSPNSLGGLDTYIKMANVSVPMLWSVEKLDDYTYDVSWKLPVRIAYLAASRDKIGLSYREADNYAYVDDVHEIHIEFSGIPYDTSTQDVAYGLDEAYELTKDVTNNSSVDIDAGELFTSFSYMSEESNLWKEDIAERLLKKYRNGKYTFTCDVSAQWAIQNNIAIGTEVNIQLPNGKAIERYGKILTFAVKNITKKYNKNSFVFELVLLEV